MELRQLKIFCTAAKSLNFTKAAAELDYVQSNITAQIHQLEEELNVKLFDRLGRNIYLTADGLKFLMYAEKILQLTNEAKEELTPSSVIGGRIAIGAAETLCVYRLPALLQEYRRLYPQVEVYLEVIGCQNFPHLLRENKIDVAFSLTKPISIADMVATILIDETMVVIASPNHELSQKKILIPADLAGQGMILTDKTCGYRPLIIKMLHDSGVQIGSLLEFASVGAIKKCVMIGLGVSIMPLIAVEQELTTGQLATFEWNGPKLNVNTQLIYHKEKWLSPALRAFIDLATQRLEFCNV